MKLHHDQLEIDAALVTALLADQFPELAGQPIEQVRSTGTVNALFRIGERHCARLPLQPSGAAGLATELRWLPVLEPALPLRVPRALAVGAPAEAFPYRWAVYDWIDGRVYEDAAVTDEVAAADQLADFVLALRKIEVTSAVPRAGRQPLRELDPATRDALRRSAPEIDVPAALAAWDRALGLPPYDGERVWIHADLLRPNVLLDQGLIAAVIDFGGTGAGDPAADLIAGWTIFGPAGRAAYRDRLAPSEEDWERARGYALTQAAMIIPYYRTTNPRFVTLAARTIEQLLPG